MKAGKGRNGQGGASLRVRRKKGYGTSPRKNATPTITPKHLSQETSEGREVRRNGDTTGKNERKGGKSQGLAPGHISGLFKSRKVACTRRQCPSGAWRQRPLRGARRDHAGVAPQPSCPATEGTLARQRQAPTRLARLPGADRMGLAPHSCPGRRSGPPSKLALAGRGPSTLPPAETHRGLGGLTQTTRQGRPWRQMAREGLGGVLASQLARTASNSTLAVVAVVVPMAAVSASSRIQRSRSRCQPMGCRRRGAVASA